MIHTTRHRRDFVFARTHVNSTLDSQLLFDNRYQWYLPVRTDYFLHPLLDPSHAARSQVFLALDKSPLLFRPVSLRGVLARPDEIAEQIASNYAVDALLRSLAVVGSLEALGSPTTLLSEWGKGVYDLFAMPIKAMPQVIKGVTQVNSTIVHSSYRLHSRPVR